MMGILELILMGVLKMKVVLKLMGIMEFNVDGRPEDVDGDGCHGDDGDNSPSEDGDGGSR